MTIGNSVTSVGDSAFRGCSGLTSVIWNAENCTRAGSYNYHIFEGCSNFCDVTMGDNVKIIPSYAFSGCSGLTSIIIPDSVTTIDDYAFEYCKNLTSIHFKGTSEQWKAIKKGSAWNTYTGPYTVYCTDGTTKE